MSLALDLTAADLAMVASAKGRSGAGRRGRSRGRHAAERNSDPSSFQAVYATWFADVLRWIRALGAPASDHDDLLQEVFVVVHRRLPHFDGRHMAAWLYRITARQVRDHRRSRWIRVILRRSLPISDQLESSAPTPLMALESREKQVLIERLLDQLSEPLRVTFVLFEIEGYTGDEIAELQQVPVNTVRARIHRARKRLLELLITWRKREKAGG